MTSSKDALSLLKKEPFDILVLCHSIRCEEAISLVGSVQSDFPKVRILALERQRGSRAYLSSGATAISSSDPLKMLTAIERLLGDAGDV